MSPQPPPTPPRPAGPLWAIRLVVVFVLVTATTLAFALGTFTETRVAQDRAARSLREHRPLEAFEISDAQLKKAPDDVHLRELAVGSADAYFESLQTQGKRAEARDWLRGQLEKKPYLQPLASKLVTP